MRSIGRSRMRTDLEDVPKPTGKKFDKEKARWDLLPIEAVKLVVEVLTYGAQKYGPENWRIVEGRRWRYYAASLRHLTSWWEGEEDDPETGLPHLAHATCCLLFLLAEGRRKPPVES